MIYLVAIAFAFLVVPALIAGLLARWRKHWTWRRIVLLTAAPLPVLLGAPCLLVFLLVSTTPAQQCAIDKCEEDRDTSGRGLALAFGGFAGGVLTAGGTVYLGRRNAPVPEADIFR